MGFLPLSFRKVGPQYTDDDSICQVASGAPPRAMWKPYTGPVDFANRSVEMIWGVCYGVKQVVLRNVLNAQLLRTQREAQQAAGISAPFNIVVVVLDSLSEAKY